MSGRAVITLTTSMQRSTESDGLGLVRPSRGGFLLAGARLDHAVVDSLLVVRPPHDDGRLEGG